MNLILRPWMPFSLASSKRMRMPSVEPMPQALTGPLNAVWLPSTISVSVTPSSASAGAASAPANSVPQRQPGQFPHCKPPFRFLVSLRNLYPALIPAKPCHSRAARHSRQASAERESSRMPNVEFGADRWRSRCGTDAVSCRLRVHVLDQLAVLLLDQAALELHGRGQLLVLGREQLRRSGGTS